MPSTKYIVRQFLHLVGASVLLVHFGPGENMPNICRVAPSKVSCDVAQTAYQMRAFHLFGLRRRRGTFLDQFSFFDLQNIRQNPKIV